MFSYTDNYINSTCADMVHVDVVNGTATIMFKDGAMYRYTNVSRRAIAKFIIDEARSLGKFLNNVCLTQRTKCAAILYWSLQVGMWLHMLSCSVQLHVHSFNC